MNRIILEKICCRIRISIGILILISVCTYADESKSYELFVRAIENNSTAPNYVLITVVNDKTKEARLICTEAPFLLGAIHRELQISYEAAGVCKVITLALSQKDRVFHFSRKDALKNIQPPYNEKNLAEMRVALKHLSDEEIRKGFTGYGKELDKLYIDLPGDLYRAYRSAIAHVLLERGLLPRRGCIAGYLTVDE
jgi:hypothetical protein